MPTIASQRGNAAVSGAIASGSGMAGNQARILILGGTAEARKLAQRLARRTDLAVTVSLAGRTAAPAAQGVPVRVGGFGGVAGLAAYLVNEQIGALIDATHPYADTISANAVVAARQADVPFVALRRPPWAAVAGDCWTDVTDSRDAVRALGKNSCRVLVALGRQELAPLADAPQHFYLIRSVDPVDPPLTLPQTIYITARGPFDEADERALLLAHKIEAVIAKNSGGAATYGKIAAARTLGIEVILLRRPEMPAADAVETVDEVMAWLDHTLTSAAARGV
jgi:precorrin-6A/cobalt-precorrin-6A reductase